MTVPAGLVLVALLVAPVFTLAGVCIGALFTHRLMRGQSPIPSLPKQAKEISDKPREANGKPRNHPPLLRA